ncbi:aromatase/cyclase [Pseudonocardia aurantiaca]|uniref:Aromatase/cyclase n=1 Tax=Pseudonocardia aurantiaca TaxID=75290 RepID=A0ABW4FRM2_9PSEU
MPQVKVRALVPNTDADAVFARISDFERYSQYTDAVREIALRRLGNGVVESEWSVNFRNGILCWSERDHVDPAGRVIRFEQLDGDFEELSGEWTVTPAGQDARVVFTAEFDLGMPSIADLINPIAERALRENLEAILRGLLGDNKVLFTAEGAPSASLGSA